MLFLIHDLEVGGAERAFLTYVARLRRTRPIPVLVRRRIRFSEGVPEDEILDLGAPRSGRADDASASAFSRTLVGGALSLFRKGLRLNGIRRRTDAYVLSTFLHKSHLLGLTLKLAVPRLLVVVNIHEQLSQHLVHHFAPGRRWIMRRLFLALLPRADRVVAVGEGVRRDLIESFGLAPDRVVVVPNPMDLERLRTLAREPVRSDLFPPGEPVLVTAGRLVRLKGIDVLLHAMAELATHSRCRLLIIGGGPERADLEALSRDLGIQDRVVFTGMQANPWKYMARSDIFVLPSRTEGRPLAIGEALALGLPVVAARCSPGVAEALGNGRLGLLVPPDRPAELAAAIRSLLEDDALRHQLGCRAPTGLEAHGSESLDLYEEILSALVPTEPLRGVPAGS